MLAEKIQIQYILELIKYIYYIQSEYYKTYTYSDPKKNLAKYIKQQFFY